MKLLRKRQNMNGIILRNHKKAHELKKVIGLRGFVVAPPLKEYSILCIIVLYIQ
jgi:hypothetical protein